MSDDRPPQERWPELEERLGWSFREIGHLREALTHSTFANENPTAGADNERLEFLGDAVLDLLVSTLLYHDHTGGEGQMSRRRARVVCQESLANLAKSLQLGEFLLLGEGQRLGGLTDSILADAYEAVAAAVFLDGGYDAVAGCFAEPLAAAIALATVPVDFKTSLQELCHQHELPGPSYRIVGSSGPDHARVFECRVFVANECMGQGVGSSKKAAEQACAQEALAKLSSRYEIGDDQVTEP